MYDAKSFFSLLAFAAIVFIAYNVLLVLRANAQYTDIIPFQETRAGAMAKFGEPVEVYGCAQEGEASHPLCKNTAAEVALFRACMIAPICPDLITLAFDKSGKVVYKYKPPKTTLL